jgi:hypothetical protein
MKLDLLKEHYFFELTRKQALESALALPIAVFTGVGGVVVTLSQTFEYKWDSVTYFFFPLLALTILSLSYTFYYICRASVSHIYQLVPSSSELLDYWEKLKIYYESQTNIVDKSTEEFENNLKHTYAETATANKSKNELRANYLYRSNVSLIFSVFFLALCAIPYSIGLRIKEVKPQKIEIENIKELKGDFMENDKVPAQKDNQSQPKDDNSTQKPAQTEIPQQSTAPVKPDFPRSSTTMGEDERYINATADFVIVQNKPIFPPNEYTKEGHIPSTKNKK